jgi:Ca2+-binding RTX toxin-like protein
MGGSGDDYLEGGREDDRLEGGSGTDTLVGGQGEDTYVYRSGEGADTIDDSDRRGRILFDDHMLAVGGIRLAGDPATTLHGTVAEERMAA